MRKVTLELSQPEINKMLDALRMYRALEAGQGLKILDRALGKLEEWS